MQIRVYYEDTDAGGIVYHANYLKFCERARSEILFEKNIIPLVDNRGFVVRELNAKFLASSILGDILEIKSELKSMKKFSFLLLQEVYKDGMKLFTMEINLVYVENGKLSSIPDKFVEIFKSL